MKKLIIIGLCFIISGCGVINDYQVKEKNPNNETLNENKDNDLKQDDEISLIEKNNLVSYNGNLKVNGINLQNQYGENFRLKGISSHGIQWFGDYVNYDVLKELRDNWNTNVFRIAMYTSEGGYLENNSLKEKVKEIVNDCIELDMYVIIDWHILHDNNPNTNIEASKKFFIEMATLYKDKPNVIYEICNEPNGNVTWDSDIKTYAETIISEIRKIDDDAVIIVGTPNYSQDVDIVSQNKLAGTNIMYALHFYAGTHKEDLRNKVLFAINNNLPIFVSEWGTSDASGNGGFFKESSEEWLNFLNDYNISWVNWSLSDKDETSAILKPNTKTQGIFDDNYLSESGKFVKEKLNIEK